MASMTGPGRQREPNGSASLASWLPAPSPTWTWTLPPWLKSRRRSSELACCDSQTGDKGREGAAQTLGRCSDRQGCRLLGINFPYFRNMGSKPRTIRVSTDTLKLFESLGRGEPGDWLFPSNKRNGPLTRQAVAARMAMWGREANVRLHPHRCRHTHATHAIRRGVDVFTLSATLGHSSTGTTSHYVLAEPGESSSLKLG